jgi:hypothetical protein
MSSSTLIVGHVDLPPGTVAEWSTREASAPKQKWPRLVAWALEASMFDGEPTVGEVLLQATGPLASPFGAIEVNGDHVTIRYARLDGSNYPPIGELVMRLASAAAKLGARGRIVLCDADDAQAGKFFNGALVTLEKGKISAKQANEKFGPRDREMVEALIRAAAPLTTFARPRPSVELDAAKAAISAEVVAKLAEVDEASLRKLASRSVVELSGATSQEQILAYLREPLSSRANLAIRWLASIDRTAAEAFAVRLGRGALDAELGWGVARALEGCTTEAGLATLARLLEPARPSRVRKWAALSLKTCAHPRRGEVLEQALSAATKHLTRLDKDARFAIAVLMATAARFRCAEAVPSLRAIAKQPALRFKAEQALKALASKPAKRPAPRRPPASRKRG